MGMYDQRCLVTGLGLTANDPATAVLLTLVGDRYRPAALGLRGIYNCYGTIDEVHEDVNADLIWTYAKGRLTDGRLVVRESLDPIDTIDDLLSVVERNQQVFLNVDPEFEPVVALDGVMIHHALISQPVWDALSAWTAQDQTPVDELFPRLFQDSVAATDIYHVRLADVAAQVRQLGAINDFLAARGLDWAPPGEERQRYPTDLGARYDLVDLRAFVETARRDAGDVEVLRAAIDEADRRVAAFEEEYEEQLQRPEQWRDEIERLQSAVAALGAMEIKRAVAVDEDGNVIE